MGAERCSSWVEPNSNLILPFRCAEYSHLTNTKSKRLQRSIREAIEAEKVMYASKRVELPGDMVQCMVTDVC